MHDDASAGVESGICPQVVRMHQLAWAPGRYLHPLWWRYLDLDGWDVDYLAHPACCRALDTLIIERRGFPDGALPGDLAEGQRKLLNLEGRLPMLLTALGIFASGTANLLLIGQYRRALKPVLGEEGCDQLCAIAPASTNLPGPPDGPEPDAIVEWLLARGCDWMHASLPDCSVWQSLAVLFPPPVPATTPVRAPDGSPLAILFRLDRLL